ncbi:DUF4179 domain-containing protein [Neobacillus drentensis]|uniref:DUF4179 domain-containing protein n=1 Tax=Neobacillus drentensis TaxID=220684 RepID=UPI0030035DE9
MFEKEEAKLTEYRNQYDNITISMEKLDGAILAGFQKAKAEKKRKTRRKKWSFTLAAAAIIFIGFFTSIRLSPAFADYITVLPGMEKLVELIRNDKGKMLAIENDYYEKLGVSQQKDGMKFTIDGVIADENDLVVFYTIHSKENIEDYPIEEPRLFGSDGKELNFGLGGGNGKLHKTSGGENVYTGNVDFSFEKPLKENKFKLSIKINSDKDKSFSLPFELKNDIQKKKTYILNKTFSIEGQKITFLETDVYPVKVAVHVKMDPHNTKKLLNFDDIRLVDENGETWNKISDGVTASKISDDEAILYLQSNYFREPKELYLAINKIQAVEKEEANVIVNTQTKQILKQPKGDRFSDLVVEGNRILFKMRTEKEFNYGLFNTAWDHNGNEITIPETSMASGLKGGKAEFGVTIPGLKNEMSPISLQLEFFPSWIEGNMKVQIK